MEARGPCEHCDQPTPYMLATEARGLVRCCGRFACEVKLRDGVDVPDTRTGATRLRDAEETAALTTLLRNAQASAMGALALLEWADEATDDDNSGLRSDLHAVVGILGRNLVVRL